MRRCGLFFAAVGCLLASEGRAANVEIRHHTAFGGTEIALPIHISGLREAALLGVDLTLEYDPTYLEATGTRSDKTTITQNWLNANRVDPGKIRILLANATPATKDGILVYVLFRVRPGATGRAGLEVSRIALNDGKIPVRAERVALFLEPRAMRLDVNGDGEIDVRDLLVIAQDFGRRGGVDVNGDGAVDMRDLVLVARHFGRAVLGER